MLLDDSSRVSRIRERSNFDPNVVALDNSLHRFYRYQLPVTTYYDEYPDPTGLSYSYEMITDEMGSSFFKNVYHIKTVRSLDGNMRYDINATFPGTTSPNYSTVRLPNWYYSLGNNTVAGHPSNPTQNTVTIQLDDLNGSLSRAYYSMLPRMEDITGGVNFINFVLELRDIKMMFSLWKKSYGVLRNLSAGVLNYSYAWRPFISDLQKMHRGLTSMQEYVDRWNEDAKAGVVHTRHADITPYVWKNDQSSSSSVTDSSWGTFCNNHTVKGTVIRSYAEEVKIVAHLYYKPNHLDLSGLNKLAAYFDVAGLGDPLSIIWEAIPFSFLVDYFLSVGRFLSQFDHDFLTTPITVVDFGYSIKTNQKYTYQRDRQIKRTDNGVITTYPGTPSYYKRSVYERKRLGVPPYEGGIPQKVDLGMLEIHMPTLRQMFLMANLANVIRR